MTDSKNKWTDETRDMLPRVDTPVMETRQTDPLDLLQPRRLRFVLSDTGKEFEVPIQLYMVIGRRSSNKDQKVTVDLAPFAAHTNGVSRYHAIIQVIDKRISIKDFNSTNGTYLNEMSLSPTKSYRLRHGDMLTVGQLKMRVFFIGIPFD